MFNVSVGADGKRVVKLHKSKRATLQKARAIAVALSSEPSDSDVCVAAQDAERALLTLLEFLPADDSN